MTASENNAISDRDRRMKWWREARFGMFIHWGLYAQLGLFPAGLHADAVEISRHSTRQLAEEQYPELIAYTLIQNSDAHFIEDIGRSGNRYRMKGRNFEEFKKALKGEEGRSVLDL